MISFQKSSITQLIQSFLVVILISSFRIQSIVGQTTIGTAPTCDPQITGYQLWYASNITYVPYLDRDVQSDTPFRVNPQVLGDGYYICYEPNPSNLEVFVDMDGCTNKQITSGIAGVDMMLTGPLTRKQLFKKNRPPHLLWGSQSSYATIGGQILKLGKYTLSTSVGSALFNPRQSISFEVIDCGQGPTWRPDNTCLTCNADSQTCIGSICNTMDYLSFNLIQEGYEYVDTLMTVTTPTGETYNYDDFPADNSNGVTKEGLDYYYSCRLYRRWIKEISFPSSTPKGTYTITLQYMDTCFNYGDILTNGPKFTLNILMNNNTVVQSFTGPQTEFTFTLL